MHNEEVTWEAHRLHDVQLITDSFVQFLGKRSGVEASGTFVSKFRKVVCLELYAIEFIYAAKFFYLLLSFFFGKLVLSILVACKLLEEIFLCELLSPEFFCAEVFWDREERHDGIRLEVVHFDLVQNLASIG